MSECEGQHANANSRPSLQTSASHETPIFELKILKTIAETLNESVDLHATLQTTLEKLLELMNLTSGWIFLVADRPSFELAADHGLPPALIRDGRSPMICSDCLCVRQYWDGKLDRAVNIIQCERLHNAVQQASGDTMNLSHHATIPITTRGERLGILNVGSPEKEHFALEELTLLQSVAFQIGSAIERARLYEQRQQQAVDTMTRFLVNYYANMNVVVRLIWKIHDCEKMLTAAVEQIGRSFQWPFAAIVLQEEDEARLRSVFAQGQAKAVERTVSGMSEEHVLRIPELATSSYKAAIPLRRHEQDEADEPVGFLLIGREDEPFTKLELELLEMLTDHISLALERMRLYEDWQDMLLAEERNRLARDLHDSVNQKLFSLSLMSSGIRKMLDEAPQLQPLSDAMADVGQLAKEALSEMRSLIWQLRPYGEVKGMLAALKEHAESIGIHLTFQMKELLELDKKVEEALWRIGQEALNNISKHAETNRAWIKFEHNGYTLKMKISDQGKGFSPSIEGNARRQSFGMTSMKERASELNGTFDIVSELGFGTVLTVTVPLGNQSKGGRHED